MNDIDIERSARTLFDAWQRQQPVELESLLPADCGAATGRAVQDRLQRLFMVAGRAPVGWKIGLTSLPALAAFGTAEPMVGTIWRDSLLGDGAAIDLARLVASRIEGEMLLEIGAVPDPEASDTELRAAIAAIRPAFEIADSRIAGWARTIGHATADNACCALLVMAEQGQPAAAVDLVDAGMVMQRNGEPVTSGRAADCMGGILPVWRWFLAASKRDGRRLTAGEHILCGAMGQAVAMTPGSRYDLCIDGLGALSCTTRPVSDGAMADA